MARQSMAQKWHRFLGLAFLAWFCAWGLWPVSAPAASTPAGRLVYLQGQVAISADGGEHWQTGEINRELFVGDAVKTGPESRCAILGLDESQLKLNENTLLVLKSVAPSPRLAAAEPRPAAAGSDPRSVYQVSQGEIWLRNSKERFPLEVETPAVTAAIRGTEFNLRVVRDGASYLTLLGGSLQLVNDYGQLLLQAGEEGLARPGQAPTKRVLVQPADAVQWSLYYPGIFSFRDLPLSPSAAEKSGRSGPPAMAGLVTQAEASYDRGQLEPARSTAAAALKLNPENSGALTILGWLSLQEQNPTEAEVYFRRIKHPDDRAVVGLALARYRLGDVAGAYRLTQEALRQLPPSPRLSTMAAFMALMVGKVAESETALLRVLEQYPQETLARALLAQIYLVQNRKDRAKGEAARAIEQAPGSPLAQLTLALVQMAYFDLPAATTHLQKALTADPRFVPAYVYLAKIQLGGDYLSRAWETSRRALQLAPRDAEVLTLAGFSRLAFRDYSQAKDFFDRAVQANPGLGEPHLGLGIYHFRYRQMDRGVAEMLTATLLEPRISLYQSELGKSLYQVRAFDKALEVYDYAKTLDRNDPTPYLYKGIALTDLNRPAEAVQEINRSIELNDNKAIFRSRLMLDRDQAVGNYSLARAFSELGMGEWAYSKAVTSVKKDPTNSSAYLFLAESFAATRQRIGAGTTSLLLYRLLSPANQNTFSQFNDYTPMYEMPYVRAIAEGGIGSWSSTKPIQAHSLDVYGGLPGLAFDAAGFYNEDRGFRNQNGDNKNYSVFGLAKWEPTVKNSLMGSFSYLDVRQGDTSNLNDFGFANAPLLRQFSHWRNYELGYVRRFNPNATLLTYYTYSSRDERNKNQSAGSGSAPTTFPPFAIIPDVWYQTDSGVLNYNYQDFTQRLTPVEFHNFQLQQQLNVGDHTLMGGFDYFSGHLKYRFREMLNLNFTDYMNQTTSWTFPPFPFLNTTFANPYTLPLNLSSNAEVNLDFRPPNRSCSFYLLDFWRLRSDLQVELGLFKDYAKNARFGFATPVYNNSWNPRVGLNYQVNSQHTLRLALQKHVNTHYLTSPSLAPPDVAGFPWQINVDEGGLVREAGTAWEAQWNAKTFSVLRLDAHRISVPLYEVNSDLVEQRVQWLWKRYMASWTLNRILGRYWGLSFGGAAKKIDPNFTGSHDFKEYSGFSQLVFWHPSGVRALVRPILVKQDLTDRGDNLFGLLDAMLGYEFPGKRGLVSLEATNILNRHFYFQREFVTLDAVFPARRIMFKLALYF
jgi:tetratricopeptide (TPR) repeat protein